MIEYSNKISIDDYLALRKSADFKALSARQAKAALENCAYLTVARDGEKAVGYTRLIFDNAYFAVLTEVSVLPDYQGHGIGGRMLEDTLDFAKSLIKNGEYLMILLLSARGKEGFYKKFGFEERPDDEYGSGMSLWIKTNIKGV